MARVKIIFAYAGSALASLAAGIFLFAAVFVLLFAARKPLAAALLPLDWVNVAFHEGGHILFGIPGNRFLMVLGGTLMQLLLPLAAVFHFRKSGQLLSGDAALFWAGQNFLGIGKYVADARAQRLDLLAGGVHDWTYLLERVGLLIHDEGLGRLCEAAGCLIMTCALLCALAHRRERRSP